MLSMREPHAHAGKVVGSGHCVALLQTHGKAPHTSQWKRGAKVWKHTPPLPQGTLIATFHPDTGKYENDTTGRSHAAVLNRETPDGLLVWDQWQGRPVGERLIRPRGGTGKHVDDADRYYVIET